LDSLHHNHLGNLLEDFYCRSFAEMRLLWNDVIQERDRVRDGVQFRRFVFGMGVVKLYEIPKSLSLCCRHFKFGCPEDPIGMPDEFHPFTGNNLDLLRSNSPVARISAWNQ
jgi:hypothetical protein